MSSTAPRWITPGGVRVDVITLSGVTKGSTRRRTTESRGDGQWLRVCGPLGYVGQVRTPAELAGLGVDVADLTEVVAA
jgi:hypothetical protein